MFLDWVWMCVSAGVRGRGVVLMMTITPIDRRRVDCTRAGSAEICWCGCANYNVKNGAARKCSSVRARRCCSKSGWAARRRWTAFRESVVFVLRRPEDGQILFIYTETAGEKRESECILYIYIRSVWCVFDGVLSECIFQNLNVLLKQKYIDN